MDRGAWQAAVHGITKNQKLRVHTDMCTHVHRHKPLLREGLAEEGQTQMKKSIQRRKEWPETVMANK